MHAALLALAVSGAHAAPNAVQDDISRFSYRAQDEDADTPDAAAEAPGKRRKKAGERKVRFEVNLRAKNMSLPRGMLNIWFTPNDEIDARVVQALDGKGNAFRPDFSGWAYGVEVAFKDNNAAGVVWFDWVDSDLEEGYFDDADNQPLDGDYLVPGPNLGIIMFGADYAYDIPLVKLSMTKGAFGMSMQVGAGLGLGVLVGQYEQWEEGEGAYPSYEQYLDGLPPNSLKTLPGFYPVLDINLGLKFNFADKFHVRAEGGLHTLLYWGFAAGMSF